MDAPLVGGLLAFLGGCAVSALNFAINLRALKKHPDRLASLSVVRQIISVAYLAAAYFLGKVLPWGYAPLLIGAAIGLTVPSVLLSLRLAKINDSLSELVAPEEENPTEEGEDQHG